MIEKLTVDINGLLWLARDLSVARCSPVSCQGVHVAVSRCSKSVVSYDWRL